MAVLHFFLVNSPLIYILFSTNISQFYGIFEAINTFLQNNKYLYPNRQAEVNIFLKRNWVFAPNFDFLVPLSLQPNVGDLIFQNMNSVRSNNLRLKYQRFTPSGWKDIGIRKFEFVAKT